MSYSPKPIKLSFNWLSEKYSLSENDTVSILVSGLSSDKPVLVAKVAITWKPLAPVALLLDNFNSPNLIPLPAALLSLSE